MTIGRLTQLGLLGLLLCVLAWEVAGATASQPCVVEAIDFRDVRAACEDGHVRDGPLIVETTRKHQRRIRTGDVIRHSAVLGGFRRDGVIAGYQFTMWAAVFLLPMGYLADRIFRPPVQAR